LEKENLWEVFTCPNEHKKELVDIYDRVPTSLNNNNLFIPSVSEYLFNNGFKPIYPEDKKFAVVISHDIDNLENDELNLLEVRHKGGVKSAVNILKKEILNSLKIKFNTTQKDYIPKGMRELLLLEEKYNIPASYYFLSLTPEEQDYRYNVKDIKHVFDKVLKVGGEIGLHGGHQAYKSKNKIGKEKKMLEEFCNVKLTGYRNHYLRFDRNVTWNALAENDFLYDTTYGDAYTPGFRNGMCYPFQPYDIQDQSFINIIEIPLVYMDESPSKYMLLDDENAWKLFCSLVEKVRKVNGVFTLLWHNTSMNEKRKKFYFRAVEYLRNLDPWFATGNQVAKHYKDMHYIEKISQLLIEVKDGRDLP